MTIDDDADRVVSAMGAARTRREERCFIPREPLRAGTVKPIKLRLARGHARGRAGQRRAEDAAVLSHAAAQSSDPRPFVLANRRELNRRLRFIFTRSPS